MKSCLETAETGNRESLDNGWITKYHNIYISSTFLFLILENHSFCSPYYANVLKKTFQFIYNCMSSVTEES